MRTQARTALCFLAVLLLLLSSMGLAQPNFRVASASVTSKSTTLYFHYTPNPPSVGGTVSNYVANTTDFFQSTKNSDYKAIGQPKISLDFYVYPNFADAVQVSGLWRVIVFANSSALHPAGWTLEFWEKGADGSVAWDSGALAPNVSGGPSGNPGYVDSPVYGYVLTTGEMSHTFSAGNTLEVEITVNTGSTVDLRIWYDSPFYPSRLVLPTTGHATVSGVSTLDVNGTARTVFYPLWGPDQRKVVMRALVTDPFGGYDIFAVRVQVTDPTGRVVVSNSTMQRKVGSSFTFENLYEYVLPYSSDALKGNYSVLVSVVDNNGEVQFKTFGYYDPFVEYGSAQFAIGTQFTVIVKLTSFSSQPLGGALVAFYASGLPVASGTAGPDGTLNITLFTGEYVAKVWWQGVLVSERNLTLMNSTELSIFAEVFDPTFVFKSDLGDPVQGVMALVTFPNGSTGNLPYFSDVDGAVKLLQQPEGSFSILAFYEGVQVANVTVAANLSPPPSNASFPLPGPFFVSTRIFRLVVDVTDSAGSPLPNVTVIVRASGLGGGRALDAGISGPDGVVKFSLPVGDYQLRVEYNGVYWLSYVSNVTTVPVDLNSNQSVGISLADVPPPIWATIGFWLIVIPVLLLVTLLVLVLVRRRRAPTRGT